MAGNLCRLSSELMTIPKFRKNEPAVGAVGIRYPRVDLFERWISGVIVQLLAARHLRPGRELINA
jgi:hypothetical protein